jgi:hypothetical protein
MLNATMFPRLHRVIESVELGALLFNQRPPFYERCLTPITLKLVITQVLVPHESS